MTAYGVLAGAAAGTAVLVAARGPSALRRVRRLTGPRGGQPTVVARTVVVVVAGAGVVMLAVLVLGVTGAVVGCGSAGALLVAGSRREAASRSRSARRVSAQLPRAADLLAACLDAGAEPAAALDLVGRELEDPLGARLRRAAAAARLGAVAEQAWEQVGPDDPTWPLARAFARAATTGSPLAETLSVVADEQRRRNRGETGAAARAAGVRAVGPLVLCFLPAFVLVGILPFVLGVATAVLEDVAR